MFFITMSRKNTRRKNVNDDEIIRALAAMQSDSSEDDEDTTVGCRDGPYPAFDINAALDSVSSMDMTLDELNNILSNKPSQSKASIGVNLTPFDDATPGPSLLEKPIQSKIITNKPNDGSFNIRIAISANDVSPPLPPARSTIPLMLARNAIPPSPQPARDITLLPELTSPPHSEDASHTDQLARDTTLLPELTSPPHDENALQTSENVESMAIVQETLQELMKKTRNWSGAVPNILNKKFHKKLQTVKEYNNRSLPVEYFLDMFPDEIFKIIADNTNKYAQQMYSLHWKPTEPTEIRAYLGMIILMGVHPLPNIDLYWSTDLLFYNPVIAQVMPCKRFKKLTENLHLNDKAAELPRTHPEYDKLCKVRKVMNILNTRFLENCRPTDTNSIDESMVKFKGRSSMKQFMPQKPIKRGYKIWARCDSVTGYLYQFDIYCGKSSGASPDEEGGLGFKVVTKLCTHVPPGTLVVFDNFFTSLPLLEILYQKGIYYVGTVSANQRDLPDAIVPKKGTRQPRDKEGKLEVGEFMVQYSEPVSVIKWRDTKDVFVANTAFNPKDIVTIKRRQKDGTKKPLVCPVAIAEYTRNMGGVDRLDHYRSSYSIGRKSRRNWFRLFWFMLEVSAINAYICYMLTHAKKNSSHIDFRVRLGRGLINNFSISIQLPITYRNKKGGVFGVPDEVRLASVGSHMPCKGKRRRCKFCSTRNEQHRTNIMCKMCNVPLCIIPCFENFHVNQY